jgi:small ubiquitin-related modifier
LQDGSEICFKVKRDTMLKKLMDAYCQRMGTNAQSVRFTYDGVRINDTDTPSKLGMEDNDLIGDVYLTPTDVTVEQKGGC